MPPSPRSASAFADPALGAGISPASPGGGSGAPAAAVPGSILEPELLGIPVPAASADSRSRSA
eukprot:11670787-Alexandrium_andersonii.AAC.1